MVKEMITNKRSSWLLNKFLYQHFKKCAENSTEKMHTDIWGLPSSCLSAQFLENYLIAYHDNTLQLNKWLQMYENHIYVNCGWRNKYESDPQSYEYYLTSNEK